MEELFIVLVSFCTFTTHKFKLSLWFQFCKLHHTFHFFTFSTLDPVYAASDINWNQSVSHCN